MHKRERSFIDRPLGVVENDSIARVVLNCFDVGGVITALDLWNYGDAGRREVLNGAIGAAPIKCKNFREDALG